MKNRIKLLIIILFIAVIICLAILLRNKENNQYIDELEITNEERTITVKQKYSCNEFEFITVTTDDLVGAYFNQYKSYALGNLEKAYNLLDEEYREKKFGNIEEYRTYIENNSEAISQVRLDSYQIKKDGENNRYICIDQNGNYYIFNETAVMDYTVMLDTYTIDLPEFIEKYNIATEQQKVALNIDRFMQAINAKDYKYAYSCLADSYKNNYFKTQEEFETYAMQNFYESSTVGYKQFDVQQDVYTYSVILTNDATGEQMEKTFVMQLGEGTEFVLSFNR